VRFFPMPLICVLLCHLAIEAAAQDIKIPSGDWANWGQFFSGPPDRAAMLEATWSFPSAEPTGPRAAVVLMHGASGVVGGERAVVGDFVSAGYAVLTVSRFTRGSSAGDVPQNATADALNALIVAAADPRIDPARIAIAGISSGGVPTIMSNGEGVRRRVVTDALRYAAHIGFYPNCNYTSHGANASTGAPMLMLMAGNDTNSPTRQCQDIVELHRQTDTNSQITVKVFNGAPHAFLNFESSSTKLDPAKVDSSRCPVQSMARTGTLLVLNGVVSQPPQEEIRDILSKCRGRGAFMGYDARAADWAMAEAKAFLAATLGPGL
jgi:dienelactone hydrolase